MKSTKKEEIYLSSMLYLINKCRGVSSSEIVALDEKTQSIIKEAEYMSLGVEPSVHHTKPKYSLIQNIGKNERSEDYLNYPRKLTLDKSSFPVLKTEVVSDEKENVWGDFVEELKYIKSDSSLEFGESLLNLLFRYTSNLAADDNAPDISMYDHIKTTASIATCLNEYYGEFPEGEIPFLLIGGDMSGIQQYIYEIVSKFAGKNLKGRSFYIRLLSDAIVRYISKELSLVQANVIYNSGGCFYILAPNVQGVKDKLTACVKTIENNLFKVHGTKLYVAISCVELSKNALLNQNGENLPNQWKQLFDLRDRKKQSRYADKMLKEYDLFFEPIQIGGDTPVDTISGEEFSKNEKPYENKNLGDVKKEIGDIKEITGKQILLGKLLRETDIILLSDYPLKSLEKKDVFCPIDLGVYYYFLKLRDLDDIQEIKSDGNGVTVVTFNGNDDFNCDFAEKVKTSKCIKCLQFYGGNHYNQLTFEEMCDNENFHRLGVLRMDVDNLGSIFQSGISVKYATLSRYSELSRSFDYFFSGYINAIQQKKEFVDKTFIVYSGGDDLFIVGDWGAIIDMSEQIREHFRVYTCFNPIFSISGGIAIVPDKYPIMRGAEDSNGEEENAKNHTVSCKSKNAVSFMDVALNWDLEFPKVKALKDNLVQALNRNVIEKSFLSKVLSHWSSAKFENHKITNMKTFWMMTYDLGRMKSRTKNDEAKTLIENCRIECCVNKKTVNGISLETDYHPLELWAFACRWAELETRSNV